MTVTDLSGDLMHEETHPEDMLASAIDAVDDIQLEEEPVTHRRGRIALSISLVLLILLLLLTCAGLLALFQPSGTGTTKEGITWLRSIYTLGANIPGQAPNLRPSSVAINPDGQTFWVTDARHNRVVKYDFNGVFKDIITLQADGKPLIYPSDMGIGVDGTLYVAEDTYNHVLLYNKDKTVRDEILIENPTAVAAGRDKFVIGGRGGFAAYALNGDYLGMVGKHGKGEDYFDSVGGIAFDDQDNIYVVDTYNNRLSKYDSVGNRIWIVETGYPANRSPANGMPVNQEEIRTKWPSAMQLPTGITVDGANRLIVIDNLDFSIAAFSAEDGSFIEKWGAYGYDDGYLYYPNDIAYEKRTDTFVLTEPMRGRAQIIRLPNSGGDWTADARRMFGDIARACCWPLLILLLILVVWSLFKWYSRRAREKQELEQAEDKLVELKEELGVPSRRQCKEMKR